MAQTSEPMPPHHYDKTIVTRLYHDHITSSDEVIRPGTSKMPRQIAPETTGVAPARLTSSRSPAALARGHGRRATTARDRRLVKERREELLEVNVAAGRLLVAPSRGRRIASAVAMMKEQKFLREWEEKDAAEEEARRRRREGEEEQESWEKEGIRNAQRAVPCCSHWHGLRQCPGRLQLLDQRHRQCAGRRHR